MTKEVQKDKKSNSFPVMPLKDIIIFPQMVAPLLITREKSIIAVDLALEEDARELVLIAQRDPNEENPNEEGLYKIGVLASVIQILKFPDGNVKAIVEGVSRVKIKGFEERNNACYAKIIKLKETTPPNNDTKTLLKLTMEKFENYVSRNTRMSPENLLALSSICNEAGRLSDIIATYLEIDLKEKQEILELSDLNKRLEKISEILEREMDVLEIEESISKKIKKNLSKTQKEFYLREKLKVIKEELHAEEGAENDFDNYKKTINELQIKDRYKTKLLKEVKRIKDMPSYSTEVAITKAYIDRVIELPWSNSTTDINDIERAQKILDEDHWGLEDVKERIIEFLAV